MTSNNPKGKRSQKEITHDHLKTVHSFSNQVQPLRSYLNDLLKMVPCYSEPGKRQSLLDHVVNVVRDHGNMGLKQHRGLFIQGIKVLGGDPNVDFTGFKLDKDGFPSHYGDIFRLLRSYRRYEKKSVVTSSSVVRKRMVDSRGRETFKEMVEESRSIVTVITEPSNNEAQQISLLLSILRWPYSVKLALSSKSKEELLTSFRKEVEDPCPQTQYSALRVGELVASKLVPYLPSDYKCPLEFVPSERTYKGGRPGKSGSRELPESVAYATGISTSSGWTYRGPVGKTSVLSERGGKTRIITSYDGAINSSNLYEKIRNILDNIPQDCSSDQAKGHMYVQKSTADTVGKTVPPTSFLYSTDLDAFTDRLVINAYRDLLDLLNSSDFIGVINAPILVGGLTVNPNRALMGLRGTFELASGVHHGIVKSMDLQEYVLCGDDLFYSSSNHGVLQRYEQLCKYVGMKLNRKKTVVSCDTGLFCGKVYFRGLDVSPVVPPLYSFDEFDTFVSAASNFIASSSRMSPGFRRVAKRLVLRFGRNFRATYVPYYLPFKLGGIGIQHGKGLLRILKSKAARLSCRVSEERDKVPMRTVRYPFSSDKEVHYSPFESVKRFEGFVLWFNNLLVKGAVSRYSKRKTVSSRKPLLRDLHTILCFYYGVPT